MSTTEKKKRGIDVSTYQGTISWEKVRASGTDFVMIKATQGRSEQNPSVRLFMDSCFRKNILGASSWGLRCGVYHYLTASSVKEAAEEAAYFLSVIEPYRDAIRFYAAADVESRRYLPKDRAERTAVVHAFCSAVAKAGYDTMIYTNPDVLQNSLGDISRWKLWLALWRNQAYLPSPEQYPNLVLWQWGTDTVGGITGEVDQNIEITPKKCTVKPIPDVPEGFYADEVCRKAGLSDATRSFLSLYKYGDDLFQKLYNAIQNENKD